jgi:hypothetical protein
MKPLVEYSDGCDEPVAPTSAVSYQPDPLTHKRGRFNGFCSGDKERFRSRDRAARRRRPLLQHNSYKLFVLLHTRALGHMQPTQVVTGPLCIARSHPPLTASLPFLSGTSCATLFWVKNSGSGVEGDEKLQPDSPKPDLLCSSPLGRWSPPKFETFSGGEGLYSCGAARRVLQRSIFSTILDELCRFTATGKGALSCTTDLKPALRYPRSMA